MKNWRIKLAAWLLKAHIADLRLGTHSLLFYDHFTVNHNDLNDLAECADFQDISLHFIEVRPRGGKSVQDCVFFLSPVTKP